MSSHAISVSSRALGARHGATVRVYDTVQQMRIASARFNGGHLEDDTLGVTQLAHTADWSRVFVTVRLARGYLGTQIVSHEMHHAATAIYGAHLGNRITTRHHLTHHNEPFAHLFSDLYTKLVNRFWDLGYYPS